VWDSLDYDFHYCMASFGAFVFGAEFTFDGAQSVEYDQANQVEVVRLIRYEEATFADHGLANERAAECVDAVAIRAGASFGEVAE